MKLNVKNKVIKDFFLSMALLCSVFSFAQQDAQYTQYMYNTVSINPAYAGSRGHMSLAGLYRAQWVGLEGAPETQTFNIHTPIGYKGLGLGLSFVNDIIGPTSETFIDLDISYTIDLDFDKKLSFGLKPSINLLDIKFSELDVNPDTELPVNIDNRLSPNVGAGIYYHTDKFYAGLSVPRILETSHFEESSLSTAKEQMNFYFMSGYVFELNPFLKFKPTVLSKITQGAPLQLDVSANFLFDEKFVAGIAYRWDAAFSGMIGFNISNEFLIGLAYDREITDLGATSFNDGSFEIILRYDFARAISNLKSPRFF